MSSLEECINTPFVQQIVRDLQGRALTKEEAEQLINAIHDRTIRELA